MLKITIPSVDFWDEKKQEFISEPEVILELEHSLVSLSKWESKFEKPMMGETEKTTEETLGYIEAMTLTPEVSPGVYSRLTQQNVDDVNAYIEAKMTATWFPDTGKTGRKEIVTAEVIYYWMIALQIPFECQHWHLKRLLTLIEVCNRKNQPNDKSKQMNSKALEERRRLNEARKARMNTKG
jgi:hypothetical protein